MSMKANEICRITKTHLESTVYFKFEYTFQFFFHSTVDSLRYAIGFQQNFSLLQTGKTAVDFPICLTLYSTVV